MSELTEKVLAYNREVKEALQTVYNELNHGQQKKLLKRKLKNKKYSIMIPLGQGRLFSVLS